MALVKKEGFEFEFETNGCSECEGKCCIGDSGYIWLTPKETEEISEFLNTNIEKFKEKYLDKIKYKFSIKEVEIDFRNFSCIFFDIKTKSCKIYEVRPKQCKTFPFWNYFRDKKEEVAKECPAIKLL